MNNFGKIKTQILNKIVESYNSNNKSDIKKILKLIKEDKDFKDLYLFYEEIEKVTISHPGSAELYLETVEPLLIEKLGKSKKTIKKVSELLENTEVVSNELYDLLDVISEKTELKNLDKKVTAKRNLIEHLNKSKDLTENQNGVCVQNESLLNAVLANNFNILYDKTLNEDEKIELKTILSMSNDDLITKTEEIKESILGDVSKMLSESNDKDLKEKLTLVKSEVTSMWANRYNYFRLKQLKNDLI